MERVGRKDAGRVLGILTLMACGGVTCGGAETWVEGELGGDASPPAGWREEARDGTIWEGTAEAVGWRLGRVQAGRLVWVYEGIPALAGDAYVELRARVRGPRAGAVAFELAEGAKGRALWRAACEGTGDWEEMFAIGKIAGGGRPLALRMALAGPGSVAVDRVSLRRLGREEADAELGKRYADGGPANLVDQSRFPLGMPPGWRLAGGYSLGDAARVSSGAAGPSGGEALRIEAPDGVGILTGAFAPVRPLVPHSAGFSAKGRGKWRCGLELSGKTLEGAPVEFDLGDAPSADGASWRSVSVPFLPDVGGGPYRLRIEGSGELWIDGLRAGPESRANGPPSAWPPEVALGLPPGDAAEAGIGFTDRPAEVRYSAACATTGAVLCVEAEAAGGERRRLLELGLGDGGGHRGEVRYDRFGRIGRGVFRLGAWIEVRGRGGAPRRLGRESAMEVCRLDRPIGWGRPVPGSRFGATVPPLRQSVLAARAAGIGWASAAPEVTGWSWAEPERGKWAFRDTELDRYLRGDLRVLGLLGSAPGWAAPGDAGGRHPWMQPADQGAWGRYAAEMMGHFRGRVGAWRVWPDPGSAQFFAAEVSAPDARGRARYGAGRDPAGRYAALLRAADAAAKSSDPSARIGGFGSSNRRSAPELAMASFRRGAPGPGLGGGEWSLRVLVGGGLDASDFFCYHHLGESRLGPGDRRPRDLGPVAAGLAEALGPLRRYHPDRPLPVWLFDGGDPSAPGVPSPRLALAALEARVERFFLRWPSGKAPAAAAAGREIAEISAMARRLEGGRFVERFRLARDVWADIFEREGRWVAVVEAERPRADGSGWRLPWFWFVSRRDAAGNRLPWGGTWDGSRAYFEIGKIWRNLPRLMRGISGKLEAVGAGS